MVIDPLRILRSHTGRLMQSWPEALLSVATLAFNAMLIPTDNAMGTSATRSRSFFVKSNPVACAAIAVYNLLDFSDSRKSHENPEDGIREFLDARNGDWDHRELDFVKNLSNDQQLRSRVLVLSVLIAVRVFLLSSGNLGTKTICAAYLAQFVGDSMIANAIKARKLEKKPRSVQPAAVPRRRQAMADVACSLSILPLAIAYFVGGQMPYIQHLWIAFSSISALVDFVTSPNVHIFVTVPVFATFAGMLLQFSFDFAMAVGLNLGLVGFASYHFGMLRRFRHHETQLYLAGASSIAVLGYIFIYCTSKFSGGPGINQGFYGRPADAPWYAYWGLLLPAWGQVANTIICFACLWVIWRMMTSPSMFIPSAS